MLSRKHITVLGLFVFLLLMFMALLFYKERIAFTDLSFHLFTLIRTKKFLFINARFVSICTQVFPLAAIQLHGSLTTITQLYSLSFIILQFAIFCVLLFYFKNRAWAIVQLLFQVLMVRHTFYWTPSELMQGIPFLFIVFAYLEKSNQNVFSVKHYFVLSLCLLPLCFSHPLIVFPFFFIVIYFWLNKTINRKAVVVITIIFVLFFIIKTEVFKSEYDRGAFLGLNNFTKYYPNYFQLNSFSKFYSYLRQDYYILLFVFFINVSSLLLKRKYVLALFQFLAVFVFVCIINVAYPDGAEQFYSENLYLPISVMCSIPFVFDVLTQIKMEKVRLVILALLCLVCIFQIFQTHTKYTERKIWLNSWIKQAARNPAHKIIIPIEKVPMDNVMMAWGSAYEFWLLSTLETNQTSSIIIEENPSEYDKALNEKHTFVTKWETFNYADLDPRYFILNDTTAYVRLK